MVLKITVEADTVEELADLKSVLTKLISSDVPRTNPIDGIAASRDRFLIMPVSDMELSVRTGNVLRAAGILIGQDLVETNLGWLQRLGGLGARGLKEIKETTAAYGHELEK